MIEKCRFFPLLLLCVLFTSCSKEEVLAEEAGMTGNPHFTWDTTVELEQPNNWCMTLSTEKIAITNIAEGRQYILTWKGGLTAGQKTDGILKTVVPGEQTRSTDLELLEIKDSGSNTYEFFLRGGGRKGEIVITR